MKNIRIISALALCGAAFLVSGCSAGATGSTMSHQDSSGADTLFLTVMQEDDPKLPEEWQYVEDAALIEIGHKTCAALDSGASVLEVVAVVAKNFDGYAAGYLVGASISSYCTEYTDDMKEVS